MIFYNVVFFFNDTDICFIMYDNYQLLSDKTWYLTIKYHDNDNVYVNVYDNDNDTDNTYFILIIGYNVFHRPHPVFSSILYVHVSEMLCTCQRCCARFPAVVHVSQKLCTFHKPPNNVRVQLHWGDQTRFPDIYIYTILYTQATICGDFNDGKKLVGGGINWQL